ncbi:hypothetical protein ABEL47_22785 [Escherichia coli]
MELMLKQRIISRGFQPFISAMDIDKLFEKFLQRFPGVQRVNTHKFSNKTENFYAFDIEIVSDSFVPLPEVENFDTFYAILFINRFEHFKFTSLYILDLVENSTHRYYWQVVYKY